MIILNTSQDSIDLFDFYRGPFVCEVCFMKSTGAGEDVGWGK